MSWPCTIRSRGFAWWDVFWTMTNSCHLSHPARNRLYWRLPIHSREYRLGRHGLSAASQSGWPNLTVDNCGIAKKFHLGPDGGDHEHLEPQQPQRARLRLAAPGNPPRAVRRGDVIRQVRERQRPLVRRYFLSAWQSSAR